MAECLNYNCDELNDHLPVDCEAFVNGGMPNAILLECGHTITDPSNATQITANINSGHAKLIKNISIDLPLRSAIKADNPVACKPQRVLNYDNTANLVDPNVNSNNIEFYEGVFGGRTFAGMILHECDADKVSWVDASMTVEGGLIKPKTNTEAQVFQGTASWRTKSIPTLHEVPAGIFD